MKKYSIKKAVLLRRARWGCGCKGNSGFSPIQTLTVRSERGRAALGTLWREDCGIASNFGLPFLAAAPARRPDSARAAAGGLGRELTAGNLDFMRSVLRRAQRAAEKTNTALAETANPPSASRAERWVALSMRIPGGAALNAADYIFCV